jgi:ATP-dependent Lhr-like helicase
LNDIRSRKIRVVTVDAERPSPFAASLLFSYVASFLYDGDAPLAERRAQALSVDQAQLRELIGDAELRELLDAEAMEQIERQLQRLDEPHHARSADAVHDMLLALGDLTTGELQTRSTAEGTASVPRLLEAGRVVAVDLAGDSRLIAVEHASRYRDAFGATLPPGIPESLLEPVRDPLGDIALRHARTHAPFTASDFAARFALSTRTAEAVLVRLAADERLLEGEFRPGGTRREWTDAGVLRMLRRRSLAKLRREVEPVDQSAFGRFIMSWQGVSRRRGGPDALLDAIEQLQGAPLAASILETEILPVRLDAYDPGTLDALIAAGEVVWIGLEALGERDGRIALYLADHLERLAPPLRPADRAPRDRAHPRLSTRESAILQHLRTHGASFFGPVHEAAGGGYPAESVDALWSLVWCGLVTNDTMHVLRAFTRARTQARRGKRPVPGVPFRSRRLAPPSAEGRWSVVPERGSSTTKWAAEMAKQLLARHGVITREGMLGESFPGGFGLLYPVLKAMEESGRVRRGYFVAGLGAAQFALPGALDLLRSVRDAPIHDSRTGADGQTGVALLAATDPANPYGTALKWPAVDGASAGQGRPSAARSVGASVVIVDGALAAYLPRRERELLTWLPESEPQRSKAARAIAYALIARARLGGESPHGMLLEEIDGSDPAGHPMGPYLREAGFIAGALGFQATYQEQRA